MIKKSDIPLFIILGIVIGSIVISLITFFIDDSEDAIFLSILVGLGFLGMSFGAFAFYGLVKAVYKKQLRAFISWIVLIAVYFLLGFAFKFTSTGDGADSGARGILYIGLIMMGVNEVWKMWKTRKPKSNNPSPLGLS